MRQPRFSLRSGLAVLVILISVTAQAVGGSFSLTGAMATNRSAHTATLLPNGKVLVAGGGGTNSAALSSAELYGPAYGTWTATGMMTTNRSSHTATMLSNGKVLVAGGNDMNNIPLARTELYDPATGMWTATGAMTTNRLGHTATLLPSGKVLVAGGGGTISAAVSSAELYDPATGMWAATGAMTTNRFNHTATLLPNGKVLVAGGGGTNSAAVSSAELYDPATGMWAATGAMTTNRFNHTATLLPNGTVLVAGGTTGLGWGFAACNDEWAFIWASWSSTELYNPSAGMWLSTAAMTTNRSYHTATLLPNGTVLVAGGTKGGPNDFPSCGAAASAELYDPTETAFLYFDNFQQFPNGTDLTTTNYTPASGPAGAAAAFMVNSGSPTVTASNFLGSTMAFINASVTTNKEFYDAELAQTYVAPVVSVTWKLWIQALKPPTSLGGFGADLFQTNNFAEQPQNNPIIWFNDSGLIWTPTNQMALGNFVTIGNWSNYVGQVMTNTLVLNFPKRSFSFAINGNLVTNMPIDLMFTNLFGRFDFAINEALPQSAGNRFAFDDVRIELLSSVPTVSFVAVRGGTNTLLGFTTLPGTLYEAQTNGDLVAGTWVTLTNNVPGTGGIVPINDWFSSTTPKRFYRIRPVP